MILSQPDLRQAVKRKQIVFDPPLEENQWGEASVDLRLGFSFTKFKDLPGVKISVANGLGAIGQSGFWDTFELKEYNLAGERENIVLRRDDFILGFTHESITLPNDIIALIEGRSTYARVGLSMHLTAPWIQPGWSGPVVLEMRNNGPLTIELTPRIDRPCQVTFFQLSSALPPELTYGSRSSDLYQHQEHPLVHKLKSGPTKKPPKKRRK